MISLPKEPQFTKEDLIKKQNQIKGLIKSLNIKSTDDIDSDISVFREMVNIQMKGFNFVSFDEEIFLKKASKAKLQKMNEINMEQCALCSNKFGKKIKPTQCGFCARELCGTCCWRYRQDPQNPSQRCLTCEECSDKYINLLINADFLAKELLLNRLTQKISMDIVGVQKLIVNEEERLEKSKQIKKPEQDLTKVFKMGKLKGQVTKANKEIQKTKKQINAAKQKQIVLQQKYKAKIAEIEQKRKTRQKKKQQQKQQQQLDKIMKQVKEPVESNESQKLRSTIKSQTVSDNNLNQTVRPISQNLDVTISQSNINSFSKESKQNSQKRNSLKSEPKQKQKSVKSSMKSNPKSSKQGQSAKSSMKSEGKDQEIRVQNIQIKQQKKQQPKSNKSSFKAHKKSVGFLDQDEIPLKSQSKDQQSQKQPLSSQLKTHQQPKQPRLEDTANTSNPFSEYFEQTPLKVQEQDLSKSNISVKQQRAPSMFMERRLSKKLTESEILAMRVPMTNNTSNNPKLFNPVQQQPVRQRNNSMSLNRSLKESSAKDETINDKPLTKEDILRKSRKAADQETPGQTIDQNGKCKCIIF